MAIDNKSRNATQISAENLLAFAKKDSDFGFEIKVVKCLRDIGFQSSHQGTYLDPLTGKPRQYDIQAHITVAAGILILAVECKNLRSNNPLLISAVSRPQAEAFHELIVRRDHQYTASIEAIERSPRTPYAAGQMVGKKTDQVHWTKHVLESKDAEVFNKMTQAMSSAENLAGQFAYKTDGPPRKAIVPVLVVPDEHLWQVDYEENGLMVVEPRQVQESNLFVGRSCQLPSNHFLDGRPFVISHLEIVTLGALKMNAERWASGRGFLAA